MWASHSNPLHCLGSAARCATIGKDSRLDLVWLAMPLQHDDSNRLNTSSPVEAALGFATSLPWPTCPRFWINFTGGCEIPEPSSARARFAILMATKAPCERQRDPSCGLSQNLDIPAPSSTHLALLKRCRSPAYWMPQQGKSASCQRAHWKRYRGVSRTPGSNWPACRNPDSDPAQPDLPLLTSASYKMQNTTKSLRESNRLSPWQYSILRPLPGPVSMASRNASKQSSQSSSRVLSHAISHTNSHTHSLTQWVTNSLTNLLRLTPRSLPHSLPPSLTNWLTHTESGKYLINCAMSCNVTLFQPTTRCSDLSQGVPMNRWTLTMFEPTSWIVKSLQDPGAPLAGTETQDCVPFPCGW